MTDNKPEHAKTDYMPPNSFKNLSVLEADATAELPEENLNLNLSSSLCEANILGKSSYLLGYTSMRGQEV